MKKNKLILILIILVFMVVTGKSQTVDLSPEILKFEPFIWPSGIPKDCPFKPSEEFNEIKILGLKSGYRYGDTWYPTWASDDKLYSPWTDGNTTKRLDGYTDISHSTGPRNHSGQGIIEGSDPLNLKAYSIGSVIARSNPYAGRYPCGSLVYNGIWYYGTYCLGPEGSTQYGNLTVNWPWMGPFVGFRYSSDYGHSWVKTKQTPKKPLFGENGINGYPVKIGAPHFVDFGKNMEHSPDGKAYLVAHGADTTDTKWRFWNDSWITGDQIYLSRVTPSIENINDISKYEFYGGKDEKGKPIWTKDFKEIKPLLEWNNNMGCVTITYNAPLKKYLMCVTDGGNTVSKMNTYILESDRLDGDWKIISYMKDFGEQAYFVNIPSKFISKDGKEMWLLYSGNFAKDWNGQKIVENPPGSHYGMVFQKIQLLKKEK
ncbi:MAG: hypothetical protein ACJA2S_003785 [Cyclobacteriaceae bacterium]|jgi:hypothetical protein